MESQHFEEVNTSGKKMENKGPMKLNQFCKLIMNTIIPICFSSLVILALTFLTYLGLFAVVSRLTLPAQTVTVSSEGTAAEMYPDSMGQYNILKDVYLHNRAVYKHKDRSDRFIVYTGSYKVRY